MHINYKPEIVTVLISLSRAELEVFQGSLNCKTPQVVEAYQESMEGT